MEELENKIAELEQTIRVLKDDLIHDSLTGLKTRRFMEEEGRIYFDTVINRQDGRRLEWFGFKNLSFVMFDIDYFKSINDTYGHATGDAVLKVVAKNIEEGVRKGDIAARWGGEEFAVLLLGANESKAVIKAEKIRKEMEHAGFNSIPGISVTVSAGIAAASPKISFEEMIKRADKALYAAKEGGRNQVVAYG
ncbi:MAG: GGDEF domain-containing protein [Candidatus Zambryskibacteria bacterium]|nr:GGDEF domain-containing protein [Candidatus Zambryskibacteria bacterium]